MRGICLCAHLGAPRTGYREGFPCSDRSQQGNPCKHELLVIKCPLNISLNKYLIDLFTVLGNFSAVSTLLPRRVQHPGPPKNPQNQENCHRLGLGGSNSLYPFKFPSSLQLKVLCLLFVPPSAAVPAAAPNPGSQTSPDRSIPGLWKRLQDWQAENSRLLGSGVQSLWPSKSSCWRSWGEAESRSEQE